MLVKALLLGLSGFAVSCATLPDEAPQEFYDANAALERMDEADVDDYFPKTVERAENLYEESLDMLKRSKEEIPTTSLEGAKMKAVEAREIAEGAMLLHNKIKSWDESTMSFRQAVTMVQSGETPTLDVTVVQPSHPLSSLQTSELLASIAFFETGKAENPIYNKDELNALAEILKQEANIQVELTGFADKRGDQQYNQKLARQRAEQIAELLKEHGVSDEQIRVSSGGEVEQMSDKAGRAAQLQFSRRVQAKLIMR